MRSPTQPDLVGALAAVEDVVAALRRADEAAERAVEERWELADLGPLVTGDTLDATAAVHIASRLADPAADRWLSDRLDDPDVAGHAAWALSARAPVPAAVPRLLALVAGPDGFDAMLAQRTLVGWGRSRPADIGLAVDTALVFAADATSRARLVDTLGALPGTALVDALGRIADDRNEAPRVRVAALGALGERAGAGDVLLRAADEDDAEVVVAALLAIEDGARRQRPSFQRPATSALRIVQVSLQGSADPALRMVGAGDQGGVDTLLVLAARALGRHPDVDHVLTIGRGSPSDALASLLLPDDGHLGTAAVAVGPAAGGAVPLGSSWDQRLAVERTLDRILDARAPFDLLHARMADVGTLAASAVARRRGLPLVFSLAPDPHGVLRNLQVQGVVDRASFGELDRREHVWFRARMVERLTRQAAALALFPRPNVERTLFELAGIDLEDPMLPPSAVVPEGIDLDEIDEIARRPTVPDAGLEQALASLPPARRGLRWLLVVGRLAPVKGVERVVRAWATDPGLRATHNLVVVGGELDKPSPTEQAVLARIDAAARDERGAPLDGLVLLGRRSHDQTMALLVEAARRRAVLVSGSVKEEFGLAIVEALAAGLVVVAPATGGPSTYVSDGDTGVLVQPDEPLGPAIRRAISLLALPGRAERARRAIESHGTIDAMAEHLVRLYRSAVPCRR